MAINDTGAIFKSFVFDGQDSRDYGAYITGSGVFNAPEREVEMVAIPGRNGALALDKGRFSNIEVAYPCGLFGTTEADFAQAASDLRNMLASRVGYCRLTDDYNAGEYRMAVYKSGLEMDLVNLKSGECSIVFECKPQRFLTSGEVDALEQDSGGDLFVDNPTLFPSAPLLEVEGYGDINLGVETVTISNVQLGNVTLATDGLGIPTYSLQFDGSLFNAGDAITIQRARFSYGGRPDASSWTLGTWSSSKGHEDYTISNYSASALNDMVSMSLWLADFQIVKGTAASGYSEISMAVQTSLNGGAATTHTLTLRGSVAYDGNDTITLAAGLTVVGGTWINTPRVTVQAITGNSSKSALGHPLYIDLDIGEAYQIINGAAVSSNSGVTLPAKLPTLAPGNTEITFDNTITDLKIIPRWWKV